MKLVFKVLNFYSFNTNYNRMNANTHLNFSTTLRLMIILEYKWTMYTLGMFSKYFIIRFKKSKEYAIKTEICKVQFIRFSISIPFRTIFMSHENCKLQQNFFFLLDNLKITKKLYKFSIHKRNYQMKNRGELFKMRLIFLKIVYSLEFLYIFVSNTL